MRPIIESGVLLLIGLALLSFLLPFSLPRDVLAMLIIAVALIALVIMRSILWHAGGTPYDTLILIGILVSVVYLFSFFAFERNALTAIVIVLFGVYYLLMAGLMSSIGVRRLATGAHLHVAHHDMPAEQAMHVDHAHDPLFRRGIKPIAEHAPPHHLPQQMTRANHDDIHASAQFKRGIEPIVEHAPTHKNILHVPRKSTRKAFQEGLEPVAEHAPPHRTLLQRVLRRAPKPPVHAEPLQEMTPPHGRVHSAAFTKGMQPIHQITAEDVHKLESYDLEQSEPKKKKKPSA